MKENIKRKIAMLLTLLGVTSIVIGTTFAIYENIINTNKNHIIKTGVINFTLTESTNGIVLNNLQELTDYEGMAQEEYYEFTIKNTGDTKTDYEISLVDKPNSSYTGTILNEKYIKVGLLKNNSEEIIVNLKEVNRLIDKVTLDVDKSANYKLRLWLDLKDITDEAKEALVGQKIFLALKINGIQNMENITIATDKLIALTDNKDNSGLYTITHAKDSTLQIGTNEDITEYRYRGANPKNYVTFNNEVWRIIGVFPTDDGTGNIENRVKIIKDQSIGKRSWDDGTTAYNYTKNDNLMLLQDKNKLKVEYLEKTNKYDVMLTAPDACGGVSNWARPASSNRYLNGIYYSNLISEAKNMIGQAKYYLGGYESSSILTQDMYSYERKISGTAYYNDTNPNNWIGKIGLMYVSDYGYASNDCNNSTNLESCNNQNWLNNIISLNTNYSDSWTITASITSDAWKRISSFYIYNHGIGHTEVCGSSGGKQIFPTMYLKSNVLITGGDGTSSNPYKLSINIQKATDKLITLTNNKDNSGLYTITHPKDTTLQIGNDKDITEYRYRGKDPKNYVKFNNETWRIIGVFPTDDGTGNIENRIKLVRNDSIGEYKFDDGTTAYNYSKQDNLMLLQDNNKLKAKYLEESKKYDVMLTAPDSGCTSCSNEWEKPTSLNRYLNGAYYNSLLSEDKNMVESVKYYLGGYSSFTSITTQDIYNYERKKIVSVPSYGEKIIATWLGKLSLMYASDYGYASSNCENKKLQDVNSTTNDLRICNDTNWLYNIKKDEWLLPRIFGADSSSGTFTLSTKGYISADVINNPNFVRPTLYLNSYIQITGGNGTSTNPYTLGL